MKTYLWSLGVCAWVLLCANCSNQQICQNDVSNLRLDSAQSPCQNPCDCNNQLFEGICNQGSCISRRREACQTPGERRICIPLPSPKVGNCKQGIQICKPDPLRDTVWGDCIVEQRPETDTLCRDGLDNDCDGKIDEDDTGCSNQCQPGTQSACYTGTPKTLNVGACTSGIKSCRQDGTWGICEGERTETTETCNGLDDNCDGTIDEGLSDCALCERGKTRPCYTGDRDLLGTGACKAGIQTCIAENQWSACQGEVLPTAEDCNQRDDDCDGKVDNKGREGLTKLCYPNNIGCEPQSDGTYKCTTPCKFGVASCVSGQWTTCMNARLPQPEVCNSEDDDCNGSIDDKIAPGKSCTSQNGEGKEICKDGKTICSSELFIEVCDSKDNNNNGQIDENLPLCVNTFAGDGTRGYLDGPARLAQFNSPQGMAFDKAGNLYIADGENHKIRKLTQITNATCGSTQSYTGTCVSTFVEITANTPLNGPADLTFDAQGTLYIADTNRQRITQRKTDGSTRYIAGIGLLGFKDGPANKAEFSYPRGITTDNLGNLYIADSYNNRIRKLDLAGSIVTTLAGDGTRSFKDGPALQAQFNIPHDLIFDTKGNLYIADTNNHRIRKLDTKGNVTTFAGDGTKGFKDGPALQAQFNSPQGMVFDTAGNLYIADTNNHRIRKLDTKGNVTTLVGDGTKGFEDGLAQQARIALPAGLAIDPTGNLYISSKENHSIRKYAP